ncbi:MAG: RDD family protein [Arcobacteraceae bacterium]|nr:RDD family protein [Arcobacteraceae bacterium]
MARWRDVKKGNIKDPEPRNNQTTHENGDFKINATTFTQIKAVITDLFMIITPLMYISIYLLLGGREEFSQNMLTGWGYIIIPYFIITVLFLAIKGQTPGLKAYEIKLVNTKDHGDIKIFQVIVRQLVSIFTTMSIIGLLLPFFRKDHRTIHDMLASTTIIKFPNK